MLVENQYVQIRWCPNNIDWYKSKGYKYTKSGNSIWVRPENLMHGCISKVDIVCDYCKRKYETQYVTHYKAKSRNEKDACIKCRSIKMSEVSRKKRMKKQFPRIEKASKEKGYLLLTKPEEYIDVKMMVRYICPIHGEREVMFENLAKGSGCNACAFETTKGKSNLYSAEYVCKIIESKNNNIWLNQDEYHGTLERNLKIKCGNCGKTFITSFTNYARHNVNKCKGCSKKESKGERYISSFLNKSKISFVREKRFEKCKDKRPLPFDFYLPEYNTCIEFDGQGHFEPKFGYDSFLKTLLHDGMKNNYCLWNNIRLIRIPYWEGHNIEEIISENLKIKPHIKYINKK